MTKKKKYDNNDDDGDYDNLKILLMYNTIIKIIIFEDVYVRSTQVTPSHIPLT